MIEYFRVPTRGDGRLVRDADGFITEKNPKRWDIDIEPPYEITGIETNGHFIIRVETDESSIEKLRQTTGVTQVSKGSDGGIDDRFERLERLYSPDRRLRTQDRSTE